MTTLKVRPPIYGLMAEFLDDGQLLTAAEKTHAAGYRNAEAYSPMPIEGLWEALGHKKTILPWVVFCGAACGSLTGFFLQIWAAVWSYPLNIGGRPLNSWVAFVPITFELTILFGAITAIVSMIIANRLPEPYHPVFNAPGFERCSQDRFFLCIESEDPRFDRGATGKFLEGLGAARVSEVAW